MASVCLSCISKKDLSSVILMHDGKLVSRKTERIRDTEVADSTYLSLIFSFTTGLNLLKMFIEENKEVDTVVFECNNSAFIKWVNQGYSKDAYQNSFIEMMEILNDIPMMYSFSYNKKPKALLFATDKHIVKERLVSLLDEE